MSSSSEAATATTSFIFSSLVREECEAAFIFLAMTAKSFLLSLSMLSALKTKENSTNTHIQYIISGSKGKGDTNVCLKTRGQYSCFIKMAVSNTTLRLERKRHTSCSRWDRSSRRLGFWNSGSSVQYRGNPSRRVGSLSLQRILKNLPLKPLQDFWKEVNKTLTSTPLKFTHSWRPSRLALKKNKNTSTDGRWPKWGHGMEKPRTNAQLFGCSSAEAVLILVRKALPKLYKGRRSRRALNTVEQKKRNVPSGFDAS